LSTCTFVLAISLFDRALHVLMNIRKIKFSLLGCACLFIASKVEEIYHPSIDDLMTLSCFSFSREELVLLEQSLLVHILKFNLRPPTRHDFAVRFVKLLQLSSLEESLVHYILEISLFDYNFNYYPASRVAAGAIHLALQLTQSTDEILWPMEKRNLTRTTEADLVDIVVRLHRLHWDAGKSRFKDIREKYRTKEKHFVTEIQAFSFANLRFDKITLSKREADFVLRDHYVNVPVAKNNHTKIKRREVDNPFVMEERNAVGPGASDDHTATKRQRFSSRVAS